MKFSQQAIDKLFPWNEKGLKDLSDHTGVPPTFGIARSIIPATLLIILGLLLRREYRSGTELLILLENNAAVSSIHKATAVLSGAERTLKGNIWQ
jgi:hypothetical protein